MSSQRSYNPNGYSQTQLWCLGLAAMNAETNSERHDLLQHRDPEQYRQVLQLDRLELAHDDMHHLATLWPGDEDVDALQQQVARTMAV